MSRSRILVAAASTALIGLAVGYGVGAFGDRTERPVSPIELEGPLPTSTALTSVPSGAIATTAPAVVPQPTLGPTTTGRPVNVAPPASTPAPTTAPAPPAPAPVPPPDDDGDDVEFVPGGEAVEPERDDDDLANAASDNDDPDDGDDD